MGFPRIVSLRAQLTLYSQQYSGINLVRVFFRSITSYWEVEQSLGYFGIRLRFLWHNVRFTIYCSSSKLVMWCMSACFSSV